MSLQSRESTNQERIRERGRPSPHLNRIGHLSRTRGSGSAGNPTPLGRLLIDILGPNPKIRVEGYDGTVLGPDDPTVTTLFIRSPDALRRLVTAPGELGLARAYVAGDIEVRGDVFDVLALRETIPEIHISPRVWLDAVRAIGLDGFRPLPPPDEEIRLHGRRHSQERDADAISQHYDVSNEFYEMVLGQAMTYSCALFVNPPSETTLEDAQWSKLELVCEKLDLREGQRMLDIGCGWGSMVFHAAQNHGVRAVGITLSHEQAEWARAKAKELGLSDQVEIRIQDYRDIHDGPFDAISSIGMFEHVGAGRLGEYFDQTHALLKPGGRLLNHGIARPATDRPQLARRGFADRYVFPDGELNEVGSVVTAVQKSGLEVRHSENLREHYALTLREWVRNLETNWDAAVAEVGEPRARVWRLYMAGSAQGFEDGRIRIHQVLATRPNVVDLRDTETMPLRPRWNRSPTREQLQDQSS